MTTNDAPAPGPEDARGRGPIPAPSSPLHPDDPPTIGGFWLDARVVATASGVAYAAHEAPATTADALLIVLSQGAANDPAARERLAGVVNKLELDTVRARGGRGQDTGRLARRFRPDPGSAPGGAAPVADAPWVALAFDGSLDAADEARRILSEVDLSQLGPQGRPSGPDYEHHWSERGRPGGWRAWPLAWPGRPERAGWLSILASWLLMLLLMCLAVTVAILLFQNAPQQSSPPPVPTSASASESSSASPPPSSASASPSESSASPSESPSSASPSPSGSGSPSPTPSPTDSASPTPSGSGSPSGGTPTPNSRL